MKFEAVGRISVGDLGIEVGGQIDDSDSVNCSFLLDPICCPYADYYILGGGGAATYMGIS